MIERIEPSNITAPDKGISNASIDDAYTDRYTDKAWDIFGNSTLNKTWKDFLRMPEYADMGLEERIKEFAFQQRNNPDFPKPAPARNANIENYNNAYKFYDDIVPAIRRNEMGVDKLSDRDEYALSGLRDVPVETRDYSTRLALFGGLGGLYRGETPWMSRSKIVDNTGGKYPTVFPHELKHLAVDKGLMATDDSLSRLQREYGFLDNPRMNKFYTDRDGEARHNILAEEMRTSNTELQYRVYSDLMKKLGRNPTAKEYFKYIDDMSDDDVIKLREKSVNGYEQAAKGMWRDLFNILPPGAEGKERADQIRYLLKSVTQNSQPGVQTEDNAGWWMMKPRTAPA